jgi:hypothetical protein
MKRITRKLFVVGFLMLLIPIQSPGQQVSSFEQLQVLVKPGDNVYVTDSAGTTAKGRILNLSRSSLELMVDGQRRSWLQNDVREIRQWRGDSLRNGALIGLGAGAGTAGVIWAVYCSGGGCENDGGVVAGNIALMGGLGAAVGAGIDALIPHKQTIFRNETDGSARLTIRPIVNRSNRGVQVAWSF